MTIFMRYEEPETVSRPVFAAMQINAIGETISYAASECALGHVLASVND